MSVDVDLEKCAELGLDASKVRNLASRLQRVANDARKMQLLIYAGCFGGLTLRSHQDQGKSGVVADNISHNCDGGDGGD